MSDVKINVIDRTGTEHVIVAPLDMQINIMEICKAHELPVDGTCGGMALCASCQIYIESVHHLPEISANEDAMLAEAFHVRDNSRLGCQIQIHQGLEGLRIRLAPE